MCYFQREAVEAKVGEGDRACHESSQDPEASKMKHYEKAVSNFPLPHREKWAKRGIVRKPA